MPPSYRARVTPPGPPIDLVRIAKEELGRTAVMAQQAWQDNLDRGEGADGLHGMHRSMPLPGPYVNTGEAVADVVVTPPPGSSLQYEVGGDVVQLAVAEWGRSPGSMPPEAAIADWAREKRLKPDTQPGEEPEEAFRRMVTAIRFAIARRGLRGFAPGRLAGETASEGLEDRVRARIAAELAAQDVDRR